MKKKSFIVFLLSSFFIFLLSAESYSKQQLIPADSWIYDALYSLSAEQKMVVNADIAPCSVKELQLYFDRIDYEKLSEPSKALFDKVQNFFEEKKFAFDLKGVSFGFNTILYPELLYKSNPDIDWTYGSFNTCTYDVDTYHTDDDGKLVKDSTETVTSGYYDVSSWGGNKLTQPLIQFPISIDISDLFYFETIPFITNRAMKMIDLKKLGRNIPLDFYDMEFMQPTNASFSTGYFFDNDLAFTLKIAKEGLSIGRTITGSVLFNDTFQTDVYFDIALLNPNFKIDMNIIEVDHTKYLYLHNFEFIPIKNLKIGATEGVLINAPFELRFLNPLMIFHSYHAWTEYRNPLEYDIYRECHESAYFGFTFDYVPVKSLRLYGVYSQIEIQIPPELKNEYGRHLPTSLALQLGGEYSIPIFNGWGNVSFEGLYSSPYMYYKTGEDWSLVRTRYDVYSSTDNPLYSWIGSPFGPDSAGFELKASYKDNKDWSVDFSYLFMARGENSFNLFGKKVIIDDEEYWIYYPSTKINGEYVEDSSLARSFALLGNIEYKNQLTLDGSYKLNDHFKFDGQLVYSFIWNNNHIPGNFQQGIQVSLAMEYRLF